MKIIETIRHYRLFSLRVASFDFSPGIISTVVTLALLYTMISLGFWQIGRAEFKNGLQLTIEERKDLPISELDQLAETADERRYVPVSISGNYDSEHSFLLDNKTVKGRVGYHVFTPVKIDATNAVLVARGFIAMGRLREQLPVFDTPVSKVELSGLLDLPPSRALLLAENVQQMEKWPAVLQYVDLTELSQTLGYELYDMVIWLNKEQAGSLEYNLPVLNLNAAKNNGYAFQWFTMSLALFIIYLVVNTKRTTKRDLET